MGKEVSPLEQEQVASLEDIGYQLRQLRERQMLTIDQIAARTMIQPRVLRAIEAANLRELPEGIYIRGFIKRYADALGVSGTEFANAFPIETDIRSINPSWQETPAAQLRPLHLYVAYVGMIAAAVWGLSYLLSRSVPPRTTSSVTSSVSVTPAASPSPQSVASPAASPSPIAASPTPTPPAPEKPVQVSISLTAESWLRVVVDGRTEFEGIMKQGTQRSWSADRELRVRAGNAGAVLIGCNNEQPKPLGKPGAVQQAVCSAPGGATASVPTEQRGVTVP